MLPFFQKITNNAYYSHNEYSKTKDERVRQDYHKEFFNWESDFEIISLLIDNNEIDLRNIVKWNDLTIIVRPTIEIVGQTIVLYNQKLLFLILFLADVKGGLTQECIWLLSTNFVHTTIINS